MCIWGAQLGIHLTRASWAQWMSKQRDTGFPSHTGWGRAATKATRATLSVPSHGPRGPLPLGTCQYLLP